MQYLFGALLILTGVFEIWKTAWLIQNFGMIPWAEQKIGSGGTWTFHKALGILLILLGFIIGGGQYTWFLDAIFLR